VTLIVFLRLAQIKFINTV